MIYNKVITGRVVQKYVEDDDGFTCVEQEFIHGETTRESQYGDEISLDLTREKQHPCLMVQPVKIGKKRAKPGPKKDSQPLQENGITYYIYKPRNDYSYEKFIYVLVVQPEGKPQQVTKGQVYCQSKRDFLSLIKYWNQQPSPDSTRIYKPIIV